MNPVIPWLFAGITMATPSMALAQSMAPPTWEACFVPGTAVLTTEGFIAVRQASAARRVPPGPGEPPGNLTIGVTVSGDTQSSTWRERLESISLELFREGSGPDAVDRAVSAYQDGPAPDCIRLSVGTVRGVRLWHVSALYFDADQAVITPRMVTILRYVIVGYAPGRYRVVVRAHDDTLGSERASQAISERRARSVSDALIRLGVAESDIEASAAGEHELAKATVDGVAEPLNRRATVNMWQRTVPRP